MRELGYVQMLSAARRDIQGLRKSAVKVDKTSRRGYPRRFCVGVLGMRNNLALDVAVVHRVAAQKSFAPIKSCKLCGRMISASTAQLFHYSLCGRMTSAPTYFERNQPLSRFATAPLQVSLLKRTRTNESRNQQTAKIPQGFCSAVL